MNYSSLKSSSASVKSFLELLSQPNPIELGYSREYNFRKKIKFENVSFTYDKNQKEVIKNVNFEIFKGEKIGIKGTTGSGKTTIIDLLMGLLAPTKGKIFIDDNDINSENNKSAMIFWKKSISHVPQNILLIDGSIEQNIALGIPVTKIDKKRVIKAAKKAEISNFIETLKYKFDTNVGEQGVKISGGQRQRISLARAFYRNSKILILDEATSALDEKTEKEVNLNLNFISDELTIIIIAHRLNTLKSCDRIFEFSNGRLIKIEKNTGK